MSSGRFSQFVSTSTLALFLLLLSGIDHVSSISVEEDLTLTRAEYAALLKFKKEVSSALPHDYMHEDIYLIRWLRARNLDIEAAKTMLMNNLRWREENDIDNILNEDFSYFEKRYPWWLDGRDKVYRPVGTADISAWDPRPPVIAGRGKELIRYATSVLELGARMVREDQKKGLNVTQFTLIANMDGFNLIQHGCVPCLPIYIRFLLDYENYFPGMLHKLFFVNTPPAFETLLRIVRPVLTKMTRDALSIHGTNKASWIKAVRELVDPDQVRTQFGGTKENEEEFDFDTDFLENIRKRKK